MDAAAHAIADPVRRRILEALVDEPHTAGQLAALFPVSRPAVSKHLRVLRDSGLVSAGAEGRHRVYTATLTPLEELDHWMTGLLRPDRWGPRLDALATEVSRTRRDRRAANTQQASKERSA
jgi:DNA-binding transcriptional ArsR family regulator